MHDEMPSLARWEASEGNGMRRPLSKGLSTFGVGVVVALMVGAVQAIPLHYSESGSEDLTWVPSTAFSLGIGNNTISGSTYLAVAFPDRPHFDSDFDSFAFSLPAGSRLQDVSIAFTTSTYNTAAANLELQLCAGIVQCTGNILSTLSVNLLNASPLHADFGGALPLSAGAYTLLTSGLGIGPVIDPFLPESWSADYRWTLRVTSVPEPGVFSLLGLGLAGFAIARRRKQ
jgi:PEP-CTERM motif